MSLRIAMAASLLAVFVVVMGSGAVSAAPRRSVSLTISATPNPIIAGEAVGAPLPIPHPQLIPYHARS